MWRGICGKKRRLKRSEEETDLKQETANSLQRALRAGEAGPHPDADVLTAFAEDALLPRERETVLAHVGRCAECREVLSLSGSAAQAVAWRAAGRRWTGWRLAVPLLAAAALIAVVSTLVLRQVVSNPQQRMTVAKNAGAPALQTVPPTPVTQPPGSGASAPKEERREVRKIAPAVTAAKPEIALPPPPPGPAETASVSAPQAPAVDVVPAPAEMAGETAQGGPAMKRRPGASASSSSRLALQAPTQPSAFANSVTTHALASASAASIARPHWRINEQGQPERAFGNGAWQPVLPNGSARMHTLAVFAGEVWVGGEKSQVFRSIDNGTSWRVVPLPEKAGSDHTIAHIRFNSAREITIEASDGTAWATTDGGASWN